MDKNLHKFTSRITYVKCKLFQAFPQYSDILYSYEVIAVRDKMQILQSLQNIIRSLMALKAITALREGRSHIHRSNWI